MSQSLSASSKQLKSNDSEKCKIKALQDSITAQHTLSQTMIRTPASSLPLYLDYKIPSKLWDLAVCQLQLLHGPEPESQTLPATGAHKSLIAMAYLQGAMSRDHRKAVLLQVLPFNEDGTSGMRGRVLEVLVLAAEMMTVICRLIHGLRHAVLM